jgi:hypothetical protein
VILFRCSGAISVVSGVVQFLAYVPMVSGARPSVYGEPGVLRTVMLPWLASIVGGLVLLLLANVLGRLVARGVE